ncbi:MAG: hemolysin III family protein, partial [archaeon]
TPICLVTLRGAWGWTLFGLVWGIAIIGILLSALKINLSRPFYVALYILMGMLAVIAIKPLFENLSFQGLLWLVIGGVCYVIGVIFYALDTKVKRTRWFGMHEIFHIFVIAGSFSHFWLMLRYVL